MERDLNKKLLEFNALELQFNEIEQQKAIIEKQITELKVLENSLDKLKENQKEKEMFSQIGPDIFVASKLEDNKKVLVNVGAKVFVKKNIEDSKKSINNDINKLEKIYKEITNNSEILIARLMYLEQEIKVNS